MIYIWFEIDNVIYIWLDEISHLTTITALLDKIKYRPRTDYDLISSCTSRLAHIVLSEKKPS